MGPISDSIYSKTSVEFVDPHFTIPGVLRAGHQNWWGQQGDSMQSPWLWGYEGTKTRVEEAINPSINQTMN